MEFFFRNLPVFLVFPTLAAFAWIHGGARSDLLVTTMPWMLTLVFEALLFFPQRRPYEDAVSARRRVWWKIGHDPVFYLVILFLVLLTIPFVNRGLCPVCDYPQILGGADPKPPVPLAPFCVNVREHWGVMIWFLPALTAMLAARHALSRSGKRLLVEVIAWNAALMVVFGFIQQASGAKGVFWADAKAPYFFSAFGYPNMGGAFFLMAFALSIGVWQTHVAEVAATPVADSEKGRKERMLMRFIKAHYMLLPASLNILGVLSTLCRAAAIMSFVVAGLAFLYHVLALLFSRHDRARRVKKAAFACGGALAFLIAGFIFAPKELSRELHSVSTFETLQRVSGKGQYHTRVATAIFKEHPLFGVGGWGYKHFCLAAMTDEERRSLQDVGGANVHNDYLQFLCEHGAVGVGVLFLILLFLLTPLFRDWYRLYRAACFMNSDKAPPRPRAIYCFPAGSFWILVGTICVLIHAFGDCPFRSAAVLSTFFCSLACADGYLPRELENK